MLWKKPFDRFQFDDDLVIDYKVGQILPNSLAPKHYFNWNLLSHSETSLFESDL